MSGSSITLVVVLLAAPILAAPGEDQVEDSLVFSSLRNTASYSANDTLLAAAVAARGVEHGGDDSLLACVRRRLLAPLPVAVAALGGSISAGSSYSVRYGGSAAWLYHAKVVQALRTTFPLGTVASGAMPRQHIHHNGALPATGPAFFEHCVEGQLPPTHGAASAPLLVLLEFGVNTDGEPAAFERLLRKLLGMRPAVALVVVNTHVWTLKSKHRVCWKGARRSVISMMEPEQREEQTWQDRFNFGDEDAIAKLCRYYDVPLVSMRAALLQEVKEGRDETLALRHFMIDCKHPSGQGHTYLAQLVLWRLLHAPHSGLRGGGSRVGSSGGSSGGSSDGSSSGAGSSSNGGGGGTLTCEEATARAESRVLPPPIHADGWPRGASRCVNGEQLRGLTSVSARGFAFTDEGRNKFGWVGHQPADEMSFCLLDGGAAAVPRTAPTPLPSRSPPPPPEAAAAAAAVAAPLPLARRCADRSEPIRGERGEPPSSCAQMRGWCGDPKFPRLLQQCLLSCGMCSPDGAAETLALWLGYLRSYEHMGRATVHCAGACSCAPSEIDAHVAPAKDVPRVSVTAVRRIAIRLSAPNASTGASCCQLRLRIEAGSSSGEHKFKLLALLLAQARATDHWQPPGTKVWAGSTLEMMHMPNTSSFDGVEPVTKAKRPRGAAGRMQQRLQRPKAMKGGGGGGKRRPFSASTTSET